MARQSERRRQRRQLRRNAFARLLAGLGSGVVFWLYDQEFEPEVRLRIYTYVIWVVIALMILSALYRLFVSSRALTGEIEKLERKD
jgi:hypothetical protein